MRECNASAVCVNSKNTSKVFLIHNSEISIELAFALRMANSDIEILLFAGIYFRARLDDVSSALSLSWLPVDENLMPLNLTVVHDLTEIPTISMGEVGVSRYD